MSPCRSSCGTPIVVHFTSNLMGSIQKAVHTWTLNISGGCLAAKTFRLKNCGVYLAHHCWAPLIQKSCDWENGTPDKSASGPLRVIQDSVKFIGYENQRVNYRLTISSVSKVGTSIICYIFTLQIIKCYLRNPTHGIAYIFSAIKYYFVMLSVGWQISFPQ